MATKENFTPPWLLELTAAVRDELEVIRALEVRQQPDLQAERDALESKIQGWKQSLANPNLKANIRSALEAEWSTAEDRVAEIDQLQSAAERRQDLVGEILEEATVLERAHNLSTVLANNDPTRGNFELSLHIDRVDCGRDGTVELRLCKLGFVPDAIHLLTESKHMDAEHPVRSVQADRTPKSRRQNGPRRRGRLRVIDDCDDGRLEDLADFVSDPFRFADLDAKWFWLETFQVPIKRAWVEENAEAVMRRQNEIDRDTGKKPSLTVLANEFGVSRPTIKTALDIAAGKRPTREDRRRQKRKFSPPLDEQTRRLIVELYHGHQGKPWLGKKEIAGQLGISRTTVDRVLNAYDNERGVKRPDGRKRRLHTPPADEQD